ncbi:class I SAM-dependent methyltransferase [Ekhidna sp.]|uniref:class I SAM-dependent methyltransferase n=1 Tax=Ekhidna sp. TaxID=2608089 RepID=UPI003C7CFAD0
MKDNFSTQSLEYAKFRPVYPQELIDYLISLTQSQDNCWDCGTGNGQLAVKLAEHFSKVYATDISEKQLTNATQKSNIEYSKQPAEQTNFPDQHFDLITVAQAAHWFDHDRFNMEVKRVLKPNGVITLIGYGLVQIEGKVGEIIKDFYWNVTHPYWDPERDHIEAAYKTIPFPYKEIEDVPSFEMKKQMRLDDLVGYISTWSAVQHYIKKNDHSPIDKLYKDLKAIWNDKVLEVDFPIFTRIGRS